VRSRWRRLLPSDSGAVSVPLDEPPPEHHNASMQASSNANAGTRFVCVTDVKPDQAADPDLIDAAVESIKEALRLYPVRRSCRPPPVWGQELHP
jgi:hypothetical protein